MSATDSLNPHDPAFERFLYSSVGEDRNGFTVTVLSALSRLNLDPWEEAADLAALGHDAARARLGLLLSRARDVPALGSEHGSVASRLARLLPARGTDASAARAVATGKRSPVTLGNIVTVMAVLLFLFQLVSALTNGAGE